MKRLHNFIVLMWLCFVVSFAYGQGVILNSDFESLTLPDIDGNGTHTIKEQLPASPPPNIHSPVWAAIPWRSATVGAQYGTPDVFAYSEFPIYSSLWLYGGYEEYVPSSGTYIKKGLKDRLDNIGHDVFMGVHSNLNAHEGLMQSNLQVLECPKTIELYATYRKHLASGEPKPELTVLFFKENVVSDYRNYTPVYQHEFTITGVMGHWRKYVTPVFNHEFNTIVIIGSTGTTAPTGGPENYIYFDDVKINYVTPNIPNTIYVENTTYSGTTLREACKHIYAGTSVAPHLTDGPVTVPDRANVTYKAGISIELSDVFIVERGGVFYAEIDEKCICPDEIVDVVLGDDFLLCSSPQETEWMGAASCDPSASYQWYANPASAISWLASPTSCSTSVTPPFGVTATVTFTLVATNAYGDVSSDQITVHALRDAACDWLRRKPPYPEDKEAPDDEIEEEEVVEQIYPNPSSGVVIVQLSNINEVSSLDVLDVRGTSIKRFDNVNTKFEIDLSDQPKGLYFIRINKTEKTDYYKVVLH